jgi:myosin heavy subunit
MIYMEILNDAELLRNIKLRFLSNTIFTLVGPSLLVVNPFEKIPFIFNEEQL